MCPLYHQLKETYKMDFKAGYFYLSESFSQMLKNPALDEKTTNFLKTELVRSIENLKLQRENHKHELESFIYSIHLQMERMLRKELSTHPEKNNISCRKGCSFCCMLNVDISESEASLLIEHCKEIDFTIDWEKAKRQASFDSNNWSEQQAKDRNCLFLSEEGTCNVYKHRPSSCRNHIVINDPKDCDMGSGITQTKKIAIWQVELMASTIMNIEDVGNLPKMLLKINNNVK